MNDTSPIENPIKARFLELVETAPLWHSGTPPAALTPPLEPEEEDEAKPTIEGRGGARLLNLLSNQPLYLDPHGGTYIEIDGDLYPLEARNPLLVETVSSLYYRITEQTMGKDTLSAAVAVLSYKARREGLQAIMANRAASSGGTIFYDLGNNQAARIANGSWEIVPTPTGLFRSWSHKRPHPIPLKPGDADRLFDFINIPPTERSLVLATLAASIVPNMARPAFVITGTQGSGKSTAARLFKMILDPGTTTLTVIPRKHEDLDLLLMRHAFLALDNLSNLPPSVADTLSAVITGAKLQRRKLHSDDELLTIHADLTLCFTSINSLSDRPDFLERTLRIQLDRIEAVDRRADDELDVTFTAALPEILGGLLSILAKGLELRPSYRPPHLPRLAAFAGLAAAIAEAQEEGAGERYLNDFFLNQGAQHLELAEDNPFFAAILEACANGNHPAGSFKDIVLYLKNIAQPDPKDDFPTPHTFRKEIERLRVPLETAGVGFTLSPIGSRSAAYKACIRFFAKPRDTDLAPETANDPTPTLTVPTGRIFAAEEIPP